MPDPTTTTTRCVACGAVIAPDAPRVEAPAPSGGGTWSLHARAADCIRVILRRCGAPTPKVANRGE